MAVTAVLRAANPGTAVRSVAGLKRLRWLRKSRESLLSLWARHITSSKNKRCCLATNRASRCSCVCACVLFPGVGNRTGVVSALKCCLVFLYYVFRYLVKWTMKIKAKHQLNSSVWRAVASTLNSTSERHCLLLSVCVFFCAERGREWRESEVAGPPLSPSHACLIWCSLRNERRGRHNGHVLFPSAERLGALES